MLSYNFRTAKGLYLAPQASAAILQKFLLLFITDISISFGDEELSQKNHSH